MACRTAGTEEGSGVNSAGVTEPSRKETNSPVPSAALGKAQFSSLCLSPGQTGQDVLEF